MPVLFSLLYLMCHALAITIFADRAMIISFSFLVAAPVIAAGVCFWRARKVGSIARKAAKRSVQEPVRSSSSSTLTRRSSTSAS